MGRFRNIFGRAQVNKRSWIAEGTVVYVARDLTDGNKNAADDNIKKQRY